jgi:hypothetical protein
MTSRMRLQLFGPEEAYPVEEDAGGIHDCP